ncbi:xanthine dehydrogenase family protein molybdopterin-binding subunit [Caenimonas aquaedulcis]|uniref:Xanthine dehydrogenase family protein molybdopterin-binding subunit n=1 Tax=Caenimonas aquaedulcis TaxID=2793270 RepID=A0A931H4L8_9BURK|nr:molybdopterin cofactor-binding domain-containing protein [Caenimonas aquaedulcis]MBG9388521.1 xanthine dehydrogenase family protein molybdopterin-binding subunit [Caenimonas aquaedulcis]
MKRRTWLLTAAGGAGALIVGWSVLPQRSRVGAASLMLPQQGEFALNGWIKVAADGAIVMAMPRSEMGQGVHTALPMLAAEELDVPLSSMRIEQAGSDSIYGNIANLVANLPFHPSEDNEDGFGRVKASRWVVGKLARELGINATGGSSSVSDAWDVVRLAAATARASLVGAASLQWKLPAEDLSVRDGVISHASGRSASYGEMARFAAATPPGEVKLKERRAWKLIGQPAQRLDLAGKVDGSAVYGVDVRLPGMKYAAIRQCPMLGGSPGAVRADKALAMPGAERLVMLPPYAGATAGFAVVGRSSWHAQRAVQAVEVEWRQRPLGALDSKRIEAELEAAVRNTEGHVFHARGNASHAENNASKRIESWYRAPYLAHATLEPMNCTARVANGQVEIWIPTQVPQMARAIAARVAGVAVEAVSVHVTLLGGGFGRRLEVDHVAQAVRVAMDCGGAPVQLLWSREEDTTHDFYRPMHVARLVAGLTAKGEVASVTIKSAGDAITPRWIERSMPALAGPVDTPDKTTSEGLFDLPYGFEHQRMEHVATRVGVPVGYWRSVGHSHNAFFSESFVDELAVQSGVDSVEFRRRLLAGSPRHLAVLNLVAEKSRWGRPPAAGRARGVALHESFGSVVAQVVEVSLEAGRPRCHEVVCAIDCGTVVNPGIVAQQMESAVVFALSAALYGSVDIVQGVVQQKNFPSYPMLRLREAPRVQTWIVASENLPAGVGEPGVPPLAPAVGNALFALTGKRVRALPISL